MKVLTSLTLLFILSFSTVAQQSGFQIKGKIKGLSNTEVYLAHYFGSNQQVIKDTAKVDESGEFVFQGAENLDEGLYLVSFMTNKYFDLVIGNSQFSFESDTSDIIGLMKIQNSPENEAFYSFQRDMSASYLAMQSKVKPEQMRSQMALIQQKWIKDHSKLFVSKLIQASIEPEIPAYPKPIRNAKDSSDLFKFQYTFYKKHFFDNIDLNDERFIRTPFLQRKIDKYFEDLVVQESDSISKDADEILAKIKNEAIRKYVVYKISSTYENHNIVGTDGAFVHLAEKYYIGEPQLWDTTTIRKMKERIAIIKPLLIGKRIPELFLTDPAGKLLTTASIQANYTILFIYDPDCSHCKEETPKLLALDTYFKSKNITVLAACILRDKIQWKNFITEFKIGHWKNGIDIHIDPKTGKEAYYTDFQKTFDAYATPVVYILDKSKKIIGKRIPVDKIQDFLTFYESKRN
ncbi:DUF4369 domain-containing protein [Aquirufa sp.]|jgi:hypothetical protein|uniref:DUF4369 domain-containing protein n=1 Tax=Aquirufa sp. TaxID=2676249 RepID=UPI0037BF04E8